MAGEPPVLVRAFLRAPARAPARAPQAKRPKTVLYTVKIITKPVDWVETRNPYVDALACPMCGQKNVKLSPAFVMVDGPIQHVNFSALKGTLVTAKGSCVKCSCSFLLRILSTVEGVFTWIDVSVDAKTYNKMLKEKSSEQLPCMCKKCQDSGSVQPDSDETTKPLAPMSDTIGMVKPAPFSVSDVKKKLKTSALEDLMLGEGKRMLTDEQIDQIAAEMKYDYGKIAAATGVTPQVARDELIASIENYVRVKFSTFQPTPAANNTLPPSFPTIVPKKLYALFKDNGVHEHMCQFIISSFAVVDNALNRADLPASVIFHHMCGMCKVSGCVYHPSNRPNV